MANHYSQQFKSAAVEQVNKKTAGQSIRSIAQAIGIGGIHAKQMACN